MSVAPPLPIGFFLFFLETSALGFAKITCNYAPGSLSWLSLLLVACGTWQRLSCRCDLGIFVSRERKIESDTNKPSCRGT